MVHIMNQPLTDTPPDDPLLKVAEMQLKLAVLDGQPWAIKHALGMADVTVGPATEGGTWTIEVVETKRNSRYNQEEEDVKS